ncbi:hypothetical protein ACWCQM_37030 [Streptomyces sp. NPDC002125]
MNIQALRDALELQEQAARALADDLREQIDGLQNRLREAETHLEHLAITRTTVTGLADRRPAAAPDLPEHPDHPRILAVFNHATGPRRARDVCQALGHELLPKNVEGTRARLKRLVKLGILIETAAVAVVAVRRCCAAVVSGSVGSSSLPAQLGAGRIEL